MKAIFRVNASKKIGGGHVSRCLTLADELKKQGVNCQFICNDTAAEIMPALKAYTILPENTAPFKVNLFIVDHYKLDASYENTWRPYSNKILVIDDLADRSHNCDYLLDQTYGQTHETYAPFINEDCRLILGPEFSLLKPQFSEGRENSLKRRNGEINNILVSYGSVDIHNLCPLTINALNKIEKPLTVNIICEADHPHLNNMKECANHSIHTINFHHNVTNMADYMSKADLALGAAGTTSWERCTLGLPAIVYQVAENQATILKNLHKQGCIFNLGLSELATSTLLKKQINSLIIRPKNLTIASINATKITDGNGALKVAKILLQKELSNV